MFDWLPAWTHDIDTWRTIGLGTAVIAQTAYVVLYATFPWWRTFLGRALFFKACMLEILICFALFSRLYEFGHSDKVFTIMYGALSAGIWFLFVAFLRVKYNGLKKDQAMGS